MKSFMNEFKKFISRGNVMDMAIGIIIGGAFTTIVSSFVEDIITPIIGLFGGMNFDEWKLHLLGDVTLSYGKFLTSVINFLIIALVLFMIIRMLNKTSERMSRKNKDAKDKAPTTKKCPFCKTEIDIEATRCPHCTSILEEETSTTQA